MDAWAGLLMNARANRRVNRRMLDGSFFDRVKERLRTLNGQGLGAMREPTSPAKMSGPLPPALQAGLLVMIAGYADAIGFLQFRAFAGKLTGNTFLLALSIVGYNCAHIAI